MFGWAQNEFANTSQVTDQTVNNFYDASRKMTGLAGNMINQYNTLFAPENAQLVQEANSYASAPRIAADMGMAGATQARAGDQAIKNTEQNLLSYGIDPSAGRYASLDKAAAVQNAANVADAENQQRVADIKTGQQLRAEAVQTGALLPSAISNAENTAIQANTGASNASLANANTGANLMGLADRYLQTAMGLKLSPVGSHTYGSGNSQHQSSSPGGGGGGGSYSGYDPSGSDGGSAAGMNMPTAPYSDTPIPSDGSGSDTSQAWDGNTIGENASGWGSYDVSGYGTYGGVDTTGMGDFGGSGYDPNANAPTDASGFGDYSSPGGSASDFSGGSGNDYSSGSTDMTGASYFAAGGPVPRSASPSQGAITDDVPAQLSSGQPAHLNANEFVVPQDVANWKGQEFFYKLIAQSRAARNQMAAAAQPTIASMGAANGAA